MGTLQNIVLPYTVSLKLIPSFQCLHGSLGVDQSNTASRIGWQSAFPEFPRRIKKILLRLVTQLAHPARQLGTLLCQAFDPDEVGGVLLAFGVCEPGL
jgi:hypothetical protein